MVWKLLAARLNFIKVVFLAKVQKKELLTHPFALLHQEHRSDNVLRQLYAMSYVFKLSRYKFNTLVKLKRPAAGYLNALDQLWIISRAVHHDIAALPHNEPGRSPKGPLTVVPAVVHARRSLDRLWIALHSRLQL